MAFDANDLEFGTIDPPELLKLSPEERQKQREQGLKIATRVVSAAIPTDPIGTYEAYKEEGLSGAAKHLGINLALMAAGIGLGKVASAGYDIYKGRQAAKAAAAAEIEAAALAKNEARAAVKADPVFQQRLKQAELIRNRNKVVETTTQREQQISNIQRDIELNEAHRRDLLEAKQGRGPYRDWEPEEIDDDLNMVDEREKDYASKLNVSRGTPKPNVSEYDASKSLPVKQQLQTGRAQGKLNQYKDIKDEISEIENLISSHEKEMSSMDKQQFEQSMQDLYSRREQAIRDLKRLEDKDIGVGMSVPPPMTSPEDLKKRYEQEGALGAAKELGKGFAASAAIGKLAGMSKAFRTKLKGMSRADIEKELSVIESEFPLEKMRELKREGKMSRAMSEKHGLLVNELWDRLSTEEKQAINNLSEKINKP